MALPLGVKAGLLTPAAQNKPQPLGLLSALIPTRKCVCVCAHPCVFVCAFTFITVAALFLFVLPFCKYLVPSLQLHIV